MTTELWVLAGVLALSTVVAFALVWLFFWLADRSYRRRQASCLHNWRRLTSTSIGTSPTRIRDMYGCARCGSVRSEWRGWLD